MYLLSNVNVREKADKESKSLKVLSTGTEVKGISVAPGWIKVQAVFLYFDSCDFSDPGSV